MEEESTVSATQNAIAVYTPAIDDTIDFRGGSTLEVDDTSMVQVNGSCSFDTGSTAVIAGDLDCLDQFILEGGASLECLGGVVTGGIFYNIGGDIEVGGTVETGACGIDCDFEQNHGGTTIVEIGGSSEGIEHDALTIFGDATLDGTLWARINPGYEPIGGEQYTVLTTTGGGTITGQFDEVSGPTAGPDTWTVIYNPTEVILQLNDPPPAEDLFTDGFESGDTSAWN